MRRRFVTQTVVLLVAVACSGGKSPTAPPDGAIFLVRACAQSDVGTFRVLLRDPALVAQAAALVGAGNVRIVSGALRSGDGGFNRGWSWHLDPPSVRFV